MSIFSPKMLNDNLDNHDNDNIGICVVKLINMNPTNLAVKLWCSEKTKILVGEKWRFHRSKFQPYPEETQRACNIPKEKSQGYYKYLRILFTSNKRKVCCLCLA